MEGESIQAGEISHQSAVHLGVSQLIKFLWQLETYIYAMHCLFCATIVNPISTSVGV